MAELVWDATGVRRYETGVDRGVLYPHDGPAVVWNGLTSMEEETDTELTSYYLDGVKFLQNLAPGEFSGKLSAFTYPDELDRLLGIVEVAPGLSFHEQPPKSFDLSYRTRIGNDVDAEAGYRIHILYNILAEPDSADFNSFSDKAEAVEFSWSLTGTPPLIGGYRPTVLVTIDSTKTNPDVLSAIEDIIYGSDEAQPRMPSVSELKELFNALGALIITDNGDGTWTATDLANDYITMDSATEFTITGADADFLDATTYEITTTNP